jgi:hypothetical protein
MESRIRGGKEEREWGSREDKRREVDVGVEEEKRKSRRVEGEDERKRRGRGRGRGCLEVPVVR